MGLGVPANVAKVRITCALGSVFVAVKVVVAFMRAGMEEGGKI